MSHHHRGRQHKFGRAVLCFEEPNRWIPPAARPMGSLPAPSSCDGNPIRRIDMPRRSILSKPEITQRAYASVRSSSSNQYMGRCVSGSSFCTQRTRKATPLPCHFRQAGGGLWRNPSSGEGRTSWIMRSWLCQSPVTVLVIFEAACCARQLLPMIPLSRLITELWR